MPSILFSRTLIAASLTCLLAACGGSSSNNKTDPQVPNPSENPQAPGDSKPAEKSETLPKLYIQTEAGAPEITRENYLKGTVRIDSENASEQLQAETKIKGRGNTTWTEMPKKPYRLKFDEAQPVLGMPADRNWALLANYSDKSMVRNKLAMELGEEAGLTYNPRSRFVELYLNDEYQGVYELFEHREVGPNKVDIEELDPQVTSEPELTGGYFIEADIRKGEDVCWPSTLDQKPESDPDSQFNVHFCAKDPEWKVADIGTSDHPSSVQYNYIRDYIDDVEVAISEPGNRYEGLLDVESTVNWYLVNELLRNNDADMRSSVFLHKPRDEKLYFGPLWDFDLAAGNINYNDSEKTEGWHIRNSSWHQRLFDKTDFGEKVSKKWCELKKKGVIDGLAARVDKIAGSIEPAAIDRNFQRWPILGVPVWPNYFVGDTYQEEVNYLKNWLQQRAAWMDAEYTRTYGVCPAS